LARVLGHLAEKRKTACLGAMSHQSCSGGTADIEDIEKSLRTSIDSYDDREGILFESSRFQDTQRPLLEASTLPREVYTSQKWFEREIEQAFMPSWFLVGREDEVVEPGSYIAIDTE